MMLQLGLVLLDDVLFLQELLLLSLKLLLALLFSTQILHYFTTGSHLCEQLHGQAHLDSR